MEELEPELVALEEHLSAYTLPGPRGEWLEQTGIRLRKRSWFSGKVYPLLAAAVTMVVCGLGAWNFSQSRPAPDQFRESVPCFLPQDFPKGDVEIAVSSYQNYDGMSLSQIFERRRQARKSNPAMQALIPKDYDENKSEMLSGFREGSPWHRFDKVAFPNSRDTQPLSFDSLALENPYLLANLQYHYFSANLDDVIPSHQRFVEESAKEMTPVKLTMHGKSRQLDIKYRWTQERGYCYYTSYYLFQGGGAMFRLNCPNAYDFGLRWIVVDFAKCKGIRPDKVRFDVLRSTVIAGKACNFDPDPQVRNCLDCKPVVSPLIAIDSLPAFISCRLFRERPKDLTQAADLNLTVEIEAAPSMNGKTDFRQIMQQGASQFRQH